MQLAGALAPIVGVTWYLHTPEGETIFADHSHKLLSMVAITMTYMTTQMIVMNMGHGSFASVQPTCLVIVLCLLSLGLGDQVVVSFVGSLDLYLQLILGLIVSAYSMWSFSAISEICYVLDIKCLTINVPKEKRTQMVAAATLSAKKPPATVKTEATLTQSKGRSSTSTTTPKKTATKIRKQCRCGATTHQMITSKKCPLNPKNSGSASKPKSRSKTPIKKDTASKKSTKAGGDKYLRTTTLVAGLRDHDKEPVVLRPRSRRSKK